MKNVKGVFIITSLILFSLWWFFGTLVNTEHVYVDTIENDIEDVSAANIVVDYTKSKIYYSKTKIVIKETKTWTPFVVKRDTLSKETNYYSYLRKRL